MLNSKKNPQWHFPVNLTPYEPSLRISGNSYQVIDGNSFGGAGGPRTFEMYHSHISINDEGVGEVIIPDMELYSFKATTNDYRTPIDKAMIFFMSDQYDQLSKTNK